MLLTSSAFVLTFSFLFSCLGFSFQFLFFLLLSLFVFALWLVFFGLCFSCGFCWPSQHQSANCHSCDRNVWHWPTLTIGADEVSGDIIVVGQYHCWIVTRLETWYIDWYSSWCQRTDQTSMTWTNTKFIQGLYLSQYEVYTYHIPAKN